MDYDFSKLVSQNLLVKVIAKVVTSEIVYLKGALKIHMPLDTFVGYVQEGSSESDLIKTYASIQSVSLQYKIQHEAVPGFIRSAETLFEGTVAPKSSPISSSSSSFSTNYMDLLTSATSLVRLSDPIYTNLLSSDPLPSCPDKHQMSQRCLNFEFDLTCPIPQQVVEDPLSPLSASMQQGFTCEPYPYPLFAELSLMAFCTRHDDSDVLLPHENTVPYVYMTPPITIPLLPEIKSGEGSIFAVASPPYLIPLEVESLQRRVQEMDDFQRIVADTDCVPGPCWGVKDLPKGLRVQLCV